MKMKYRKKPIVVEAFQYKNDKKPEWFNKYRSDEYDPKCAIFIDTLEGSMKVYPGDMIIKGIQGEIYPCKKDIFDATYDLVEE